MIKTLLVPIDFSDASLNALDYAVQLAAQKRSRIVLFNAYTIPVVSADVPVVIPVDEMAASAFRKLGQIKAGIIHRHPELTIELETACGFPAEEILLIGKRMNIDLIIMGMTGTSNLIQKILGSVTTVVMQKSNWPLLVVGPGCEYKSWREIALATDFNELRTYSILNPLRELIYLFKAKIHIVHVATEEAILETVDQTAVEHKLLNQFSDIDCEFQYLQGENIAKSINEFVVKNNIDLLVAIHRQRSFLQNLFHQRQSKNLAVQATIPVLILPG